MTTNEKYPTPANNPYEYSDSYTSAFDESEYKKRPTINRHTNDIRGGVYYGTYKGEAIVVDPEKYPEAYQELFDETIQHIQGEPGAVGTEEVLQSVYEVVSTAMPYSKKRVDRIFQELAGGIDGAKIDLSTYIEEGVGVCRHQALTCATLLEMLKDEGYIDGQVRVHRNIRHNTNVDDSAGHAWVRYTDDNEATIIDIAQGHLGPLEMNEPSTYWDYRLSEERPSHAQLPSDTYESRISRRKAIATTGALGTLVVAGLAWSLKNIQQPNQNTEQASDTVTRPHTVKEGETLWDITYLNYPEMTGPEIIEFYTYNIVNKTAIDDPARDESKLDDLRPGDVLEITGPPSSQATPASQ